MLDKGESGGYWKKKDEKGLRCRVFIEFKASAQTVLNVKNPQTYNAPRHTCVLFTRTSVHVLRLSRLAIQFHWKLAVVLSTEIFSAFSIKSQQKGAFDK